MCPYGVGLYKGNTMAKIEFGELAKKLGVAKRVIRRLVYMPKSTLRYTEATRNGIVEKFFDEEEVLEMLKKGQVNAKEKA